MKAPTDTNPTACAVSQQHDQVQERPCANGHDGQPVQKSNDQAHVAFKETIKQKYKRLKTIVRTRSIIVSR